MKRATHIVVRALLRASVLSSLATVGWSQQPSITWFAVPAGYDYCQAHSVSADGTVVAITAYSNFGPHGAYRWTQASGMQYLGTLGGAGSLAYNVSANGAVIVGVARNAIGQWRAFRWTQATACKTSARWAVPQARRLACRRTVASSWADPTTPVSDGALFGGRKPQACKTSARWGATPTVRHTACRRTGQSSWADPTTARGASLPSVGRKRTACKISARFQTALGAGAMRSRRTAR